MRSIETVILDIEKMSGMKLKSIRPGADIVITNVDHDNERVILTDSSGNTRSRPFNEIEKLWRSLCSKAAIHVDSELGGSGSSRNQPETILANLPYIEFFKLERKKHLTLMTALTHDYGTLKELDIVRREEIRHKMLESEVAVSSTEITDIFIVSDDLKSHSDLLKHVAGSEGKCLEQGVYEYMTSSSRFILLSESTLENQVPTGSYVVVNGEPPLSLDTAIIKISDEKFKFLTSSGVSIFFRLQGR